MNYKESSFFDEHQIEPNISQGKLRVLFQTDPDKRKDLPKTIKIISNQKTLLQEELFTKHAGESELLNAHRRLLESIKKLHSNIDPKILESLSLSLKLLAGENINHREFYYASGMTDCEVKSCVVDFIVCIFDEIEHVLINGIEDNSNGETILLYDFLTDISQSTSILLEKKEKLDCDLCEYVDNTLSIGDASQSFKKKFTCLIKLISRNQNPFFKESLLFTIDKMKDDFPTYGSVLLDSYQLMIDSFPNEDAYKFTSIIERLGSAYSDLTASKDTCSAKEMVAGCRRVSIALGYALDHKDELIRSNVGKYSTDEEQLYFFYKWTTFVADAGVKWYKKYCSLFISNERNSTIESMYLLVKHVVDRKPEQSMLNFIANAIISKSDFKQMLEFLLAAHVEVTGKKTTKFLDAKDIDLFIGKYYWLIYAIENESINETLFNNIRMFSFDSLILAESYIQMIEHANSSYERTELIEEYENIIVKLLCRIPKDFYADATTRCADAVIRFGGIHTGSVSESSTYIDLYCDLFGKKKTKYGRKAYNERSVPGADDSDKSNSTEESCAAGYDNSGKGQHTLNSNSSGGCYIATAIYGSYDCPEVWTLRRYRDYSLAVTWHGRVFIRIYYAISPTIVRCFGNVKLFRKAWRLKLDRMVRNLQSEGYESTPYNDKRLQNLKANSIFGNKK